MSHRAERQQEWAVFWCSLLGPLLSGDIAPKEAAGFLAELAERKCHFPDGEFRKPSRATLWRKWKQYRQGGFDALQRRRRKDRGQARKPSADMIDKAIALKKEQPFRSDETINQFLEQQFARRMAKSTLYRHLKHAGATRLKLGVAKQKVRCRWTRDQSNVLWLGDFQDGPYVIAADQVVDTHLSAFIDCHSRYVVEARYYLRENLDILIDSLLRAWASHGASRELYLDNAKIYHADALKTACAALNIRLLHRAVGDPPPGGLIERFFQTTQTQFEAEVRAGEMLTLERLNQALAAWLEVSYHDRTHSETGQTPRLRYEMGRPFLRHVDIQQLIPYFLKREQRTVHRDFSDVQLRDIFFRVDPRLRGDKVQVRYDPFGPLDSVLIYSLDGEYCGVGTRHTRQQSATTPASNPSLSKPAHNYLDLLIQKHQQAMSRHARGIDYQAVLAHAQRRWPFVDFVKQLASHLGRAGGLSAFRADELESLQKVYQRLRLLNPAMLELACARARQHSVVEILFVLQQLHDERRS